MKTALKILIFIALGELIFQAHKHWGIEQVNDIADDTTNLIKPPSATNTIYLLGDSYTKGLGVAKENRLVNSINVPGYFVADYSHSSDNWADYTAIIQSLEPQFVPGDYIVIGVNWNDIQFNKGAINYLIDSASVKTDNKQVNAKTIRKNTKPKGLRKYVHFFYRNSAMTSFLSSNIQNTLKRHGMPLPVGDFHYLKEVAYEEKKDEMTRVMNYLQTVVSENNINVILYLMPDFNLTKNIGYFKSFNRFFNQYQNTKGISVIDGPTLFVNSPDGYYCLSVHDGHPNDSAHVQMAKHIHNDITSINTHKQVLKNTYTK